MIYVAVAELAVILVLVLLLNRARDHEVRAILDVMTDSIAERADLLNAARQPSYLVGHEPPPPVASAEETERMRVWAENAAKIGTVE